VVTRAASVVRAVKETLGPSAVAPALEFLINNTLEAQGHKALRQCNSRKLSDIYDPAFVQADCDLSQVATGLQARPSARLCLYGPPGTGKTAYGCWLARELTAPLLVKRASDLMSMWVGGNEKNIADAFKEAKGDGAVLLIDEVDSFLQDRRGAQRGWEVSLVNEMLTQMESFDGVFIASTNLMAGLDQAALRRFDLKVKFDFLTTEKAWELLLRHCDRLTIEPPSLELKSRLQLVSTLTPGDFAVVARQHVFRPLGGADDFVAGLEAEVLLKEGGTRPIGFLQ
jgi:transitional endoplasmic reticulum ATPase